MSEARLALVIPPLAAKIRQMSDMVAPVTFRVTQGLRSWGEQAKLYSQGRDDPGKIVTDAPPGHSYHNFALAVDVVPLEYPNLPDWNLQHPSWQRLLALGLTLGLQEGAQFRTFPDRPHFQLTGRFPASPDDEVRQIFLQAGIQGVWQESGLLGEKHEEIATAHTSAGRDSGLPT